MKRFLSILLAALLCFGVAALPAAAEDAAEPEPTRPAASEQTEPPVWSPYEAPTDLDFDDYWAWEESLCGRYYYWRSGLGEDRPRFDPAFRQFYRDDPELFIENHLVFKKVKSYAWEGKKRVKRTYAVILDYFDTQDACTTLHIPATLDGCPVSFYMFSDSAWTAGLSDSGYTNNTVKKLILEEGITGVGPFAFSNFTRLIAVRIPSTVTSIGVSAFRGCTALRKVFGCAGLERLQSGAFQGCEKLRFFANMDKLKGIEGGAFANTGFKTLTLSGGVTLGGGDEDYYEVWKTFADCKKLKKVTFLPADKKATLNIGSEAFSGCPALKAVVLPETCGKICIGDYAFRNCAALKTLKNTGCLAVLDRRVFEGCTSLKSLSLPAGFEHGSYDTFRGSSLKELEIRSKDTKLFDGSHEVYWLLMEDRSDRIDENFLTDLPKSCTVYVVNKDMKYAVHAHGFKGRIVIRVDVPAPETAKATKQNGAVTFTWSKVTQAEDKYNTQVECETIRHPRLPDRGGRRLVERDQGVQIKANGHPAWSPAPEIHRFQMSENMEERKWSVEKKHANRGISC